MKRIGPLFVGLGVAAAVPASASCTHTIDGTGGPAAGGTTTSSPTATPGSCVNIAGTWDVPQRVAADACDSDSCLITQSGCNLVIDCIGDRYNGTIDGSKVEWTGQTGATCTGTVGPEGVHLDGSCTGNDGTCILTATKQ